MYIVMIVLPFTTRPSVLGQELSQKHSSQSAVRASSGLSDSTLKVSVYVPVMTGGIFDFNSAQL